MKSIDESEDTKRTEDGDGLSSPCWGRPSFLLMPEMVGWGWWWGSERH